MTAPRMQVEVEIQEPPADPAVADHLRETALAVLRRLGSERGGGDLSASIVVTDDETVRELNRTYRGVDRVTDVLSFAAREGADFADAPAELAAELAGGLGDIFIALPRARRQAEQYGHSLLAELQLLVIHGALHLLGYDHDQPQRQAEMWQRQTELLAELVREDLSRRIADEAVGDG